MSSELVRRPPERAAPEMFARLQPVLTKRQSFFSRREKSFRERRTRLCLLALSRERERSVKRSHPVEQSWH